MIGRSTTAAFGAVLLYGLVEVVVRGFEDPPWLRWLAGENGGLFVVADPAASLRIGRSMIGALIVLTAYATAIFGAAVASPEPVTLHRSTILRLAAGCLAAIVLTACTASSDRDPRFSRQPGLLAGRDVPTGSWWWATSGRGTRRRTRSPPGSEPGPPPDRSRLVTVGDNVRGGDPERFPEAWGTPYG
jgi:hypothetical protein